MLAFPAKLYVYGLAWASNSEGSSQSVHMQLKDATTGIGPD